MPERVTESGTEPGTDPAALRAALGEAARIVFVSGNFNVLHPGHVRLLKFARELGDHLVVGVHPDGAPGVGAPVSLRLEGVRSNRHVSHAFALAQPVPDTIAALRPQVVVKGREHENGDNVERAALAAYGGQLMFSSGEMLLSSVSTLDDEPDPRRAGLLPRDYMARHGIGAGDLAALVRRLSGLNVVVIGDVIVDEYIDCDPLGMSQEDPTIVVTPINQKKFLGGAGIVAAHAAGLGANVTLVTVGGEDETARFAQDKLRDYGVECAFHADASRPTTLKQRFRASGKTLLRVSHLRQHAVSPELGARMAAEVAERMPGTDLILFSDFNYGCLPQRLVSEVTEKANAAGVPMAADSQASSQLSDITRFRGMRLVTPTELEARLALKDKSSGIVVIGHKLLEEAGAEHAIITLASEGMVINTRTGPLITDRIAALNPAPKDVAGAGDSLFCATSLALTAGGDIWQASLLGAIAAACQVGRVGNTPLQASEVVRALGEAMGESP